MDQNPLEPNPDDYTPDDEEYWTGLEFPSPDDPEDSLFVDYEEDNSEDNQDYTPEDYEGLDDLFERPDDAPSEDDI